MGYKMSIIGGILLMLVSVLVASISIYLFVVMMVVGFFVWLTGVIKK